MEQESPKSTRRFRGCGQLVAQAQGSAAPDVEERPSYPKAPLDTRARAYIEDVIIAFLPLVFMFGAVFLDIWTPRRGVLTYLLLGAAAEWAIYYYFAKDGAHGQSLGKRRHGLMVVNVETNRPCSTRESIVRQVDLFFLQLLPVIGWFIEPTVALMSRTGRRIGDRKAGTQVIEVKAFAGDGARGTGDGG